MISNEKVVSYKSVDLYKILYKVCFHLIQFEYYAKPIFRDRPNYQPPLKSL